MDESNEFEINELGLVHEGGTKFYKVSIIVEPDREQAVLIKRWGKVGSHGEHQIEKYSIRAEAQDAYYEAIKKKQRRGYSNSDEYRTTKVSSATQAGAELWVRSETSLVTGGKIMSFLINAPYIADEIGIVSEEPAKDKTPDRSGDENWATW